MEEGELIIRDEAAFNASQIPLRLVINRDSYGVTLDVMPVVGDECLYQVSLELYGNKVRLLVFNNRETPETNDPFIYVVCGDYSLDSTLGVSEHEVAEYLARSVGVD